MGAIIEPGELTESGERACLRLNEIYESSLPPAQLITGIGTVVERHVGAVLGRLIYLSDVQSTRIGAALVDKLSDSFNSSWSSRKEWLSDGFGISYSGTSAGQRFHTLVELRNAIVHGDGALSDMQEKRSLEKLLALRRDFESHLAARFIGRVLLTEESSQKAMGVARHFILEFDRTVISTYPDARRF